MTDNTRNCAEDMARVQDSINEYTAKVMIRYRNPSRSSLRLPLISLHLSEPLIRSNVTRIIAHGAFADYMFIDFPELNQYHQRAQLEGGGYNAPTDERSGTDAPTERGCGTPTEGSSYDAHTDAQSSPPSEARRPAAAPAPYLIPCGNPVLPPCGFFNYGNTCWLSTIIQVTPPPHHYVCTTSNHLLLLHHAT